MQPGTHIKAECQIFSLLMGGLPLNLSQGAGNREQLAEELRPPLSRFDRWLCFWLRCSALNTESFHSVSSALLSAQCAKLSNRSSPACQRVCHRQTSVSYAIWRVATDCRMQLTRF
jgi:hypothetical protein